MPRNKQRRRIAPKPITRPARGGETPRWLWGAMLFTAVVAFACQRNEQANQFARVQLFDPPGAENLRIRPAAPPNRFNITPEVMAEFEAIDDADELLGPPSGDAVIVGPGGMLGEPIPEGAGELRPLPFEVRVSGPVDSLVGDMVELHAETTSDATQYAWSISPPVRGLLILDGGAKAVFTNRNAGEYLVICSVANQSGQAAHATMPFTLRPSPPENPLTAESLGQANPPPDLPDLIRRWVAEVESNNKPGEAAAVASSLRQTANLLANGALQPTNAGPTGEMDSPDPLYEVERAVEIAMGPANFPRWQSFFGRVRDYLHPLNQQGYIVTPVEYANTFNNLAGELEAIAAGR